MRLLDHLPDSLPFIAASTAAGAPRNWSFQRIVEALIIAAVTALASSYVTIKVLDERVADMNRRMDRMEIWAEARYNSLQEDVRRIYSLLATERAPDRTRR